MCIQALTRAFILALRHMADLSYRWQRGQPNYAEAIKQKPQRWFFFSILNKLSTNFRIGIKMEAFFKTGDDSLRKAPVLQAWFLTSAPSIKPGAQCLSMTPC